MTDSNPCSADLKAVSSCISIPTVMSENHEPRGTKEGVKLENEEQEVLRARKMARHWIQARLFQR